MRERLVAAFVGLTVAVVALFGIPRAYLVADLVTSSEQAQAERTATLVAAVVAQRQDAGGAVDAAFLRPLLGPAETVSVVAPGESAVVAGSTSARPSRDDVVGSATLADGTRVTVRRSASAVADRVSAAILPIVLLGLGLTVAAGGLGYLLARRLSRPFGELAVVAGHIGHGRFDVEVPHYGIPEAEAIGDALRRGSAQLDEMVRRERDFTVSASHELRSPITALRLEVEDLAMWPQTPPDVAAELKSYLPELDRLSAAIGEYLDTARRRQLTEVDAVDLTAAVVAAVERARPRLDAGGQEVRLGGGHPVEVVVSPAALERLLDEVLDDLSAGPAGEVSVTVEDAGAYALVNLTSSTTRGEGAAARSSTSAASSTSAGSESAASAARLALSLGGHLSMHHDGGRRVVLALPRRDTPAS